MELREKMESNIHNVQEVVLEEVDSDSEYEIMELHEKMESNIHNVQEVVLKEVDLDSEYEIVGILGKGSFAKKLLALHRETNKHVVLKAVYQKLTTQKDFFREFHDSCRLSQHPYILNPYPVAFIAEKCFVFIQEYAPFGSLAVNVKAGGLREDICKYIAKSLSSALNFLHSRRLVHRDIKLENVLVFSRDVSRIKLCDFGHIERDGTLVNKIRCTSTPFIPPEIWEVVHNDRYTCKCSADCWQFGMVLFVCLTGNRPWQIPNCLLDPDYSAFQRWVKGHTNRIPDKFRIFSPRLLRYFCLLFEDKPEKRARANLLNVYLKDDWFMNSWRHSATSTSIEASLKMKLLNDYGLETAVDQKVVTKRIWEWVMQCDSTIDDMTLHANGFSGETL